MLRDQLIGKRLVDDGRIYDQPTVTGKSLFTEIQDCKELTDQKVVRHFSDPVKSRGGYGILYGDLAPEGCVVKLAGHGALYFQGSARVFESEEEVRRFFINKSTDALKNMPVREILTSKTVEHINTYYKLGENDFISFAYKEDQDLLILVDLDLLCKQKK